MFAVSFFAILFFCNDAFASTVTLAPTSGVAGQTVIITGSAFDNNTATTILWDDIALTTTPATVTTSASGAIPASGTVSFTVPSGMYGVHTVRITTGSTNVGVATFTINTPTVAVTSPTGAIASGVTLTVTATNLESTKTASFYLDDTLVGTGVSTVGGVAELVFAIPDLQNTGTHILRVQQNSYAVASTTITINAPTLTVAPTSGAIGTKATITGTNFRANTPVSFFMNGVDMNTDNTVTANGSGGFAVTFTIPNLAPGANTLKAQSSVNLYATTTVTVSTPSLTLSPAAGTAGMKVMAYGTGFSGNTKINFFINDDQLDETVTANNFGSFKKEIEIPDKFPTGAITVRAQSDVNDSVNFAIATYTITASAVTASPTAGVPGTEVTLTGTNFDPNKTVIVRWNGSEIETSKKSLKTNSAGSFLTKIKIPSDYVSGNGQIEVYTNEASRVLVTFAIANPTLSLSAASGLPGSDVMVTGANFGGNKKLKLLFDETPITTSPRLIKTTPLGGFVAVFTVPDQSKGTHSIVALTEGDTVPITATTVFTVAASSITLGTSTVQANTKLDITGTGFRPRKPVTFLWDNLETLTVDTESVTTDDAGFFSAVVSIPEGVAPGTHMIKASSDSVIFATSSVTVTTGSIVFSKEHGSSGETIQITGSNFDVGKPVTFLWDGNVFDAPAVETDGIGGFSVTIAFPASSSGMHSIKAMTSEFSMATEDFGIDAPELFLSPEIGVSRGSLTLSGRNFTAGKTVVFSIDDRDVETSVQTDGSGGFTASLQLPFTFASSLRIGVRTGEEDRTVYAMNIDQPGYVLVFKKYGEWGMTLFFLFLLVYLVNRFDLLRKGMTYGRKGFEYGKRGVEYGKKGIEYGKQFVFRDTSSAKNPISSDLSSRNSEE